ncbi:MAG TPA: hypothetical protein VMU25_04500 [Candidatus Paceibacterota bacterium]|nr:hypothetical protein [Candidatus Paceibacterota bacterium]
MDQPQKPQNDRMILRLRKTDDKKTGVELVKRGDHFRKTLLLAGALGALALSIYLITHARQAQDNGQPSTPQTAQIVGAGH